ncbi:F1 complex, gamma subunit of ATPase [Paraphysoderma sedebokerense]|nr:F1 complex, gamma subunit of ATPase [Paraphysoderma sedebokerense]
MFSRFPQSTVPLVKNGAAVYYQQQAGMATLKEIQIRLKSIKNIAKITKSMKMIATTKMTRAQRVMNDARAYGQSSAALAKHTKAQTNTGDSSLLVAVTSDRGLCGGVHSAVAKVVKRELKAAPGKVSVVALGDKARGQISRESKTSIKWSFNQLGKNVPTFEEASVIADAVLTDKELQSVDKPSLVFNEFKSVIAYETTKMPLVTYKGLTNAEKLSTYEIEDSILTDLHEFMTANAIYWAMCEGHASEMSSRRTAMENATKNAGDMIDRLTLTYNRSRQAAITNELVDIITGASAL